jgi:hypothetical protein
MRLYFGTPNEKQLIALRATKRNVGFGGARGGGKSWFVRAKTKANALKYPGIRQLIVRRTYKELQSNHIDVLRSELQEISRYNGTDKQLRLINGSIIDFAYCAKDDDLKRLQGIEYDIVYFDEAEHLTEYQMKTIGASVRGTKKGFPKHVIYAFNPGGPGHQYLKRIFVDRSYNAEEEEDPDDYVFVQSLVTDNKILMERDPDYIKQLKRLPEKLRKAWLEGCWDIYEGQFFEEFRVKPDVLACEKAGISTEEAARQGLWTHVIPAFQPPDGWRIYRSFDWGYSRPFSCGWWAVDYDGRLYRILELYGCTRTPNEGLKWTPDKVFSEIARVEREHPWLRGKQIFGVADPAIWDASTGVSIEETASKYHIYFDKGDHARIPGWMQCHYRMAFDTDGRPMMYVFDNCQAFLRTVPTLVYDEHNVEDLDTSMEDHVADEWRYMCMARPIKPVEPQEARVIYADPLDQFRGRRDVVRAPGFGF